MTQKSMRPTILSCLCIALLISAISARATDLVWPLKGTIDLSDGFGDFRDGRFHAGLDLRTGGRVGVPVYAPVDGQVYRIKTNYLGYGKGLYIKGSDNCLYVFGHLLNYAPSIDSVVKAFQFAAERYSVDTIFAAGGIAVKKGDLIAYSGQTGTTAPHLHFEKRITDESPVNPLTHGFTLEDKSPPILRRLGFAMVDDKSLFANGQRTWFLDLHAGDTNSSFTADSAPFFSEPFGVLLDGFDRIRPDGMNQAITLIRLEIDNQPIYESHLDTLAFSAGKSVYFEYSFEEAINDKRDVRRLYHTTPNKNPGSRGLNGSDGIIDAGQMALGKHVGRITAQDGLGNTSYLEFSFFTAPQASLLSADSVVRIGSDTTRIYFAPRPDLQALRLDSIGVEYNLRQDWQPAPDMHLKVLPDSTRIVEITSERATHLTLRLRYYFAHGASLAGEPFYGLIDQGSKKVEMAHDVIEGGMIVTLKVSGPFGSLATLRVYGSRGISTFHPCRFFDRTVYRFFIPVRPEFARIDSIFAFMDTTGTFEANAVFRGPVWAVGYSEADTLAVDSLYQIIVRKSDLPQPVFVELQKSAWRVTPQYRVITNAYRLLPLDFPTMANLQMRLKLDLPNANNHRGGLCDFDAEKNKWKWLPDSRSEKNVVTASTAGGGTFAVKLDITPPLIYGLNIQPRQRIVRSRPVFEFNVLDSLSGIGDDTSFDIRLDRKWMIPEFDPNTGICTFAPPADLSDGDHHLAIKVTDRAGNLAEQYLIFTVATNRTEGKK